MTYDFDLRSRNKYINNSLLEGFISKDLGTKQKSLPQVVQEQGLIRSIEDELNIRTAVYGYHSAVKSRMEQAIVSRTQRHPGIPSSHLGLDLIMDLDDKIDFRDVLGTERPTCPLGKMTVNDALESIFRV
ncbi:hypothetical protein FG386_003557 [Cryptosporidium ryanae]|uniref:uncharacterized protein n=1 Tax=Cryptosporidium ryanae TaxID=515981 RepID=UPI003519F983|nr:hypothetical protein FG386_003557 [Cryptosporidium ryanae]